MEMATIIEIAAMGIILPWLTWVSSSIFNQRQEIAILKEQLKTLKEHAAATRDVYDLLLTKLGRP